MAVTYEQYINHLKNDSVRHPRVKIEFLRLDETVYNEITGDVRGNSGTLNINRKNGQRRSINFELININGEYLPNPDGIWLRQKIKVWRGLIINGEEFWMSQGVFVMSKPVARNDLNGDTLTIDADDKFCLAETIGGEVDAIYIIPVGTNVDFAIRSILMPSTDAQKEIFYDPTSPIIDSYYSTLSTFYTIEIGKGQKIAEALYELAEMGSANMYYNVDGRLVFERDVEDNKKGSIFSFEKGDLNYRNSSRTYDTDNVYNACLVVGDNINGEIFDYYIENLNLQSPTSIPNVGWKRVLVVEDSNIYTTDLARIRCEYELKNVTILLSSFDISCTPHILHLDVDKVIEVSIDKLDVENERVLINSISIPLSNSGDATISCAMTSELTFE